MLRRFQINWQKDLKIQMNDLKKDNSILEETLNQAKIDSTREIDNLKASIKNRLAKADERLMQVEGEKKFYPGLLAGY